MILLLPLGAGGETARTPWVTYGLLLACAVAFALTATGEEQRLAETQARLERIAEGTLRQAGRRDPGRLARRAAHATALGYLEREGEWRLAGLDPEEQARLESCLADDQAIRQQHPFYRLGFTPAAFSPVHLLTHLFLHGDIVHLAGNLLFLWAIGSFIEATHGPWLFAGLYLGAGTVAALSHALANSTSTEPAIGASGAIAGLMGFFAIAHHRERLRVALVAMLAVAPRIRLLTMPAWIFLGLWLLEQLFWVSLTAGMRVGIAYWAHLGGFAAGAIAAWASRWLGVRAGRDRG